MTAPGTAAFGWLEFEARWVCWRNEIRNGKTTKVPHSPHGGLAKADDPRTWNTRSAAEARIPNLVNGEGGGLGVELGDLGDGLSLGGVDLDTCRSPDGKFELWAADIIQKFASYTEISPSDTGAKIFFRYRTEDLPTLRAAMGTQHGREFKRGDGKDHPPAIELHLTNRYFTVTERKIGGAPDVIADVDAELLLWLLQEAGPAFAGKTSKAIGSDSSRSATAFRKGAALRRSGNSFEDMVEALRADPDTADWCREKGEPNNQRELRRIWDRAGATGQTQLKRGLGYTMQKVSWLWPGWLARGKLHLLGGQKGAGKSTVAFDLLAQITCEGKWPDGTAAPLGDVLIWSGEDDIEDTILPRFAVAGGDLDRVFFIDGIISSDGMKRAFDPAADMPSLLIAIRELPELQGILIDPIVSATAGDSHKNSETRRGLQPLVDLATERNIALIGITHFTKGTQGQDPIERITGSLAFGAIPRVVWAAAKSDSEDGPRRLVRIGSNIGQSGGGFEYLLRQDLVLDFDFTAQRIVWGKRLEGSPLELLENSQEKSKKTQAIALLDTMLGNGPVPVSDIKDAASANGISWPTIERAKTETKNIVAEQAGRLREIGLLEDDGSKARGWYWRKIMPKAPWIEREAD